MKYQLLSVNHRTAPLEVRERLTIPESRLSEVVRELLAGVAEEAMVLSTCNRVELLVEARNGHADLRAFLREQFRISDSELAQHATEMQGAEAVRHVFRVASSLDSMVVGEPQILGQVKHAYAAARAAGGIQSELEALLAAAFATAKRVRSETMIGSSAVSIASVAVDLAMKIFGSLAGKTVYLVGAGKMSELAARHLLAQGAGAVFVANRTHERARQLAERFGGQALLFEQLYETADRADIVITSTGAPHHIFRREHGELFMARRKRRPMFFIDIAVPRDVDPALNQVEGIFVYDIDDLQGVVAANSADRRREAERAERIVDEELARFAERQQTRKVVPTILSLQEQMEAIRQAEVERARGRLGPLTPEQEQTIEAMTRAIINKVLHMPITTLKSAASQPELATVVDLVRRMFNLQQREKEEQAEERNARKHRETND